MITPRVNQAIEALLLKWNIRRDELVNLVELALAPPPEKPAEAAPQEGLFEKGWKAGAEAERERVAGSFERSAQMLFEEGDRLGSLQNRGYAVSIRASPPAEPSAPQAVAARLTDAQLLGDPAQTVSWPAHPPAPPAPVSAPQQQSRWITPSGTAVLLDEWTCPDCGGQHVPALGGIRVGHPCERTSPPASEQPATPGTAAIADADFEKALSEAETAGEAMRETLLRRSAVSNRPLPDEET